MRDSTPCPTPHPLPTPRLSLHATRAPSCPLAAGRRLLLHHRRPWRVQVEVLSAGPHFLADTEDSNYSAARRAVKAATGKDADLTREGGSIPFALWLSNATRKSTLLLPIGASDDSAHSQNEKLNVSSYVNGAKILAAYLEEIGSA